MIEKEQILSLERPHLQCAECGVTLEEMVRHPSRLRLREGELIRSDFCPDCWEFAKGEAYESYWVTKRVKKEKVRPHLSRREKAVATRALFESLWDRRDQEDVEAHLYFLAHLLLRWGGLKWKCSEVERDGRETIIFENPATGDMLPIRAVDTTEESIGAIRDRIEEFLSNYAPEGEEVELD